MSKLQEIIKTADIHADNIKLALKDLNPIFPINEARIKILTREEFLLIELLTNRFAKLQDLIGTKIVDMFFKEKEEIVDNLTMIDKLNKLERLEIIENIELWRKMRHVRNYLTHEYPDHPEITADYLNQLVELSPKLLDILQNIKQSSLNHSPN